VAVSLSERGNLSSNIRDTVDLDTPAAAATACKFTRGCRTGSFTSEFIAIFHQNDGDWPPLASRCPKKIVDTRLFEIDYGNVPINDPMEEI
jgi:hypothetical protein